jgi:shikimate dehydrogenase
MTDRYAVMGNPIAHSKSPLIHSLFAEQTGQDICYEALLVPEDGFATAVDEFRATGGRGLNITVPFKQQAWELVDRQRGASHRAGAVNTITFDDDGSMIGDNTDGIGIVRDLSANQGITLKHRSVLILGAGGAVRGILEPLLAESPASVTIANRTLSRAEELAALFDGDIPISACGFDQLEPGPADLIINGTSASLQGTMPELPDGVVGADTCAYDMMYGARPTVFMDWATRLGARLSVDGLGMLVEQAAESFRIWRGVHPETAAVIESVRRGL